MLTLSLPGHLTIVFYDAETSIQTKKQTKKKTKKPNPFESSSEQTGDLLVSSRYNKHRVCSKADAFEDAKFRLQRNRHQRTKMHCFKVRIVITREGKKGRERRGQKGSQEEEE